jgi:hypothetical protein
VWNVSNPWNNPGALNVPSQPQNAGQWRASYNQVAPAFKANPDLYPAGMAPPNTIPSWTQGSTPQWSYDPAKLRDWHAPLDAYSVAKPLYGYDRGLPGFQGGA